ncbi:uncharacterized protein LOC112501720 [Cynara cardunculus var. scolymus]|uniref:uncharacterized protein LOC112501720 n=1 Tax=Cynara cardunculus var. scolymus TaxID=59895 RepID=UPI000D62D7AE|nr:uncharacterized protein LOC112501720 [Cynara cardunculus var. scolymus]
MTKLQADKKRREVHFQVGEWVYVKLKSYRQVSVANKISHKLVARFFGPFKVVERVGPVKYKLQLPITSKVHSIFFHASLLKKAVTPGAEKQVLQSELDLEMADQLVPEAVKAVRTIDSGGGSVTQWLVQWKGQTIEEATWEDAELIQSQFPIVCLKDKTFIEEDGNDTKQARSNPVLASVVPMPRIWKVYSRRKKGVE